VRLSLLGISIEFDLYGVGDEFLPTQDETSITLIGIFDWHRLNAWQLESCFDAFSIRHSFRGRSEGS
jgi:hypothetical protein